MTSEKTLDTTSDAAPSAADQSASAPSINLPKGGGAIKGIGEKFGVNPVNGTGTLDVPIFTTPGRADFYPKLSLSYDSGSGNGPFGFGWDLSVPHITRKTDKGLPRYFDAEESDVFILSGAEDLVPVLAPEGQGWIRVAYPVQASNGVYFTVHDYRPRVEGLFARIERWVDDSTGETYWKSVTRDNITSLYGVDAHSRISDPGNALNVFTWLLAGTFDDRGNVIVYTYKEEDGSNVPFTVGESNRQITANRYLKHIHYGNPTVFDPLTGPFLPTDFTGWYFKTVFDYGEHDPVLPTSTEVKTWACRPDPFSSYRSCFEVRTYRLCSRVLMFHQIPEMPEIPGQDNLLGYQGLVRATHLHYSVWDQPSNPLNPLYAYLESITQAGYSSDGQNGTISASIPPLEFSYTQAMVDETIHFADPSSLENLPLGVDGAFYQWTDLDSEGSPGILTEQGNAWFYKRNISNLPGSDGGVTARFEPVERVMDIPSSADLRGGGQQLMDLAGDGQLCLVQFSRPMPGYYERGPDRQWQNFTPFLFSPNIDWKNPNLRMLDLDGDGFADVLITEDEVFTWYPSYAKAGFGPAETVRKPFDEDRGPALVFADGTQSIYVSDMSGDGLKDMVRLRNGEVCYWPNLGYGRFGAKITMDASPWVDTPDQFDQKRVRLADIDGSGTTDILYLDRDGIRFWYNQSGNSWSPSHAIPQFPAADEIDTVNVVDLLGNGTACLVWSSPLPGDVTRPLRYIDLMGSQKPHLLVKVKNNLGAETKVRYVASTRFYLADRLAGQPWVTRLAFPVHVVDRVETFDWVSRNRFVSCYSYHHGYYDGIEREFRGFGMVEQQDAEELGILTSTVDFPGASNIAAASYVPPVLTKTWYHTGAYPMGGVVSRVYAGEYYRESDLAAGVTGLSWAEFEAMTLADTALPAGLVGPEIREAIRSLKGSMLRQEIYALDGTEEADRPYNVSENNFTIKMLQPFGGNRHAVFFTHARESIALQYERKLYDINGLLLADPRVTHQMVLAVDDFGNELQSVAIGYGRRQTSASMLLTGSEQAVQSMIYVTYTESCYTLPIFDPATHRTPLPAEVRGYELIQISPVGNVANITNFFGFEEMAGYVSQASDGLHDLPYEDISGSGAVDAGQVYRRMIGDTRTIYLADDLSGQLALGMMGSLALLYQTYKQAFTGGLLTGIYLRTQPGLPVQDLLTYPAAISLGDGGYVDLDRNGNWWIPSGQSIYSPVPADPPDPFVQDPVFAAANFYLPQAQQDPFGQYTRLTYDGYNLLLISTADALGNTVVAQNDYRVMQPFLITDPNLNRTQVAFDALGLVVATAVMGKVTDSPAFGDSIPDLYDTDPAQSVIDTFFSDPINKAAGLLGTATSCFIYDLGRFKRLSVIPDIIFPVYAATIQRETHVSDLVTLPGGQQGSALQIGFSYSDGFGREIQRKAESEPGPVVDGGPVITPRWIGSGWTIFNNKGKPVRQYEPFFTASFDFDYGLAVGVSPILFYDPAGRVVVTIHPDYSWEKVVFDPWVQQSWDRNDTVLIPNALTQDPSLDVDVGDYFLRIPRTDYFPTWYSLRSGGGMGPDNLNAAQKAALHANTPTLSFFDTLGRSFLTIANNGPDQSGVLQQYHTFTDLDVQSYQRSVTDALGRIAMAYDYDMLGTKIHQSSIDAGQRWMLNDVLGKQIYRWDARGHVFWTEYDVLRRPTQNYVLGTDPVNSDPRTVPAAGSSAGGSASGGASPTGVLFEWIVYGEGLADSMASGGTPALLSMNMRGKVFMKADMAGVVTSSGINSGYDFKGNLLSSTRQLLFDYQNLQDWSGLSKSTAFTVLPLQPGTIKTALSSFLEGDLFLSGATYDALNRPVTLTTPDQSITTPTYNKMKLLETVSVNLQGSETVTPFVSEIEYNAKGQRTSVAYGNNASTKLSYDPFTFRVTCIRTTRPQGINDIGADLLADQTILQDLNYTYDPVGNITRLWDYALITSFNSNIKIQPLFDYTYDPIYRLITALGREQIAQAAFAPTPPTGTLRDYPFMGLSVNPNDLKAMQMYTEQYKYDPVGNFCLVTHVGSWKRTYSYNGAIPTNNCVMGTVAGPVTEQYKYDLDGNMASMTHLAHMAWDFKDQLLMTQQQAVNVGTGPQTLYLYDSAGQRVRKVNQTSGGTRINERIYLGGYEVYREYSAASGSLPSLERQTLHVMDDKQRVALVETIKVTDGTPNSFIRYELSNHLGSALMELGGNTNANILTYEEYYPYGCSAFQAVQDQRQTPKRYRYTGKERDEENGFYYHGARYLAPWLGRWVSCDPAGLVDGVNVYSYARSNPVRYFDSEGYESNTSSDPKILALGLSQPPGQKDRGMKGIVAEAKNSFPDQNVVDIEKLPGWASTWEENFGDRNQPGGTRDFYKFGAEIAASFEKFKGIGSAVSVQEALEGGGGITDIHMDIRSVDILRAGHTGSELRSIMAALSSGANTEVNVHLLSEGGLSTIKKGTDFVSGASLPEAIAEHLPPSFSQNVSSTLGFTERAVGFSKGLAGELTESLKSAIPGYNELKLIGGGSASFGLGLTKAYIEKAIQASVNSLTGGVAAGTITEMAVASGAVAAGAGSVALAGITAVAAKNGQETPLDVADKYYGTHFGDLYGWLKGDFSKQ